MKNTKRKWPKIVGISVGSVIGLLALVILLLPTIISSNFAKNRIVNSLKTSLGRDVHIDDISMSWSSGFDIKNIHIKERDGLPGDTFVKTDRILCDIKVLPLLKKQIKIRNLVIDNPEIVLQRGKKGISKYEDKGKPVEVIPSPETMEEYAPEVVGKPAEKPEYTPLIILPLLSDIRIKAKINNGKFTFIDHRLNEKTIIKNFDTTLNIESIDKPIELKSVFDIEAKDKTEHADISLHVSLAEDGKINPRNANGTFNLKTGFARMIGDFDMARFSGKGGTGFDFLMNVDLKEFTEKFSGILGLPEGMQMKGVINSKITAEGRLDEVIGIDGITEIANLNISGGPFKDKTIRESKIRLFQNADIDMVSNDVTIHKISVNTSFIEVKSSGTLNRNRVIDLNTFLVVPNIKKLMDNFSGIVSLPQGLSVSGKIAGEINVNGSIDKEIKLSGKTILYGVTATGGPLKDTKISNLNLKLIHTLDYDKTEDSVNIEKMDVASDFLDMSSKGKITSLSREQNIDYKLSLNMDLDNINTMFTEMLPVNTSMTGKGIVDLGLNGKLSTKDNFYEDVNLNGNVSIDTIKYDSYKVTDLKSGIQLDDGLFTTKDFVFKLNEGQGNVSAKVNLKEEKPPFDFGLNLSGVRINQKMDILAYAMPILPASDGQISGMLNMMLNANGNGLNWQDELSKSLNAVGEINIKDGYVKGDKIISNILKKEEYSFDDIITQFKINDEKIFVDNLKVDSKDFNIGLSGWTSFDGQIEYTADAEIIGKSIGGDAEKILGMLGKGSKLPIVITGTVNNPRLAFKWPKPQDIGNLIGGLLGGGKDLKQKTEEAKEPATETFNENEKEKKTAETSRKSQPERIRKEDVVDKLLKSLFK
jgi:uncharacterized protein involved in outer membrane biogenesis